LLTKGAFGEGIWVSMKAFWKGVIKVAERRNSASIRNTEQRKFNAKVG
jgi:hypothetical protein